MCLDLAYVGSEIFLSLDLRSRTVRWKIAFCVGGGKMMLGLLCRSLLCWCRMSFVSVLRCSSVFSVLRANVMAAS